MFGAPFQVVFPFLSFFRSERKRHDFFSQSKSSRRYHTDVPHPFLNLQNAFPEGPKERYVLISASRWSPAVLGAEIASRRSWAAGEWDTNARKWLTLCYSVCRPVLLAVPGQVPPSQASLHSDLSPPARSHTKLHHQATRMIYHTQLA